MEHHGPPVYMGRYAATLLAQAVENRSDSGARGAIPESSAEAVNAADDLPSLPPPFTPPTIEGPSIEAPSSTGRERLLSGESEALPILASPGEPNPTQQERKAGATRDDRATQSDDDFSLAPVEAQNVQQTDSLPAPVPMAVPEVEQRSSRISWQDFALVHATPNAAEVRKAQAEIELAEAVHNKVCQDVARDVTLTYQKLMRARAMQKRVQRPDGNVNELYAEDRFADVADFEAELRFLLGIAVPVEQSGKLEFPPVPERVEDMIVAALRSNPDVKEAAAKIEVARMNFESVSSRVDQVAASSAQRVSRLEELIDATSRRVDSGTESSDKLLELRFQLDEAKQAARALKPVHNSSFHDYHDSHMDDLHDSHMDAFEDEASRPQALEQPVDMYANSSTKKREIPVEMKRALEVPYSLTITDMPLHEAIELIANDSGDLNFVIDVQVNMNEIIALNMNDTALKNVLLAIADQVDGICFVIRDYGILVTTINRARIMNAPTIPEDVDWLHR